MYQRNLFLIQIEHANRLAASDWPQEKRLALILLENLFELAIRRKVERIFDLDKPGWDEKRILTSKKKKNILKFYPDLLAFAFQKDLISSEEQSVLQFIHDLRNKSYHGYYPLDEELVELGLLMSCSLIRNNPMKWITGGGIGYAKRKGFSNRFFGNQELFFLNVDKEIPELVPKLLPYGIDKVESSHILLEKILIKEVERIRKDLETIRDAIQNIDFNIIFTAHGDISNIVISDLDQVPLENRLLIVLAYHDCATHLKEELNDIDSRAERYRRFAEAFDKKLKSRPKYPLNLLQKFSADSLRFSKLPLHKALEITQGTLASLEILGRAASDAAICFHEYVQHEVDRIRGK